MAMAEKIKKRVINLLPNKNDSVFEQFLNWAITVGRLLIIITETLALSVFLYRFVLDVKIIDLHDKIKSESLIVENFKEGENNFRNLQMRLAFAKEYDSKKDKTLTLFQDIVALGQNKITFINLNVKVDTITIEAQSPSAVTLNLFAKALKNHPDIKEVSIDRVENSPSSGLITIAITAELKTNLQKTSLPTSIKALEKEK